MIHLSKTAQGYHWLEGRRSRRGFIFAPLLTDGVLYFYSSLSSCLFFFSSSVFCCCFCCCCLCFLYFVLLYVGAETTTKIRKHDG